jgi:hypothetical protein
MNLNHSKHNVIMVMYGDITSIHSNTVLGVVPCIALFEGSIL